MEEILIVCTYYIIYFTMIHFEGLEKASSKFCTCRHKSCFSSFFATKVILYTCDRQCAPRIILLVFRVKESLSAEYDESLCLQDATVVKLFVQGFFLFFSRANTSTLQRGEDRERPKAVGLSQSYTLLLSCTECKLDQVIGRQLERAASDLPSDKLCSQS